MSCPDKSGNPLSVNDQVVIVGGTVTAIDWSTGHCVVTVAYTENGQPVSRQFLSTEVDTGTGGDGVVSGPTG